MKNKYPHLQAKVEEKPISSLALSSVTLAELEYGISKSKYPEKNKDLLYGFISPFDIVSFSELDAENFGYIRAILERSGTPIGPYDLQIAAQCLTRNLCLITNNVKEFERVPNLKIENWIDE
ncbi:tRNA(fMet)-specific endonuclease VapC [Spirochaeta isovalerica]|uniref:tRNA(fMet)-specific endonuclease VapC n=2 Tax=Spirochaeta isovalerica TaxID=150 RepID=A0A841R8J2_9SPIO|nr:tRNA(fMet)-specific endonuclease VapC [Spirochaeta isovalerica]